MLKLLRWKIELFLSKHNFPLTNDATNDQIKKAEKTFIMKRMQMKNERENTTKLCYKRKKNVKCMGKVVGRKLSRSFTYEMCAREGKNCYFHVQEVRSAFFQQSTLLLSLLDKKC